LELGNGCLELMDAMHGLLVVVVLDVMGIVVAAIVAVVDGCCLGIELARLVLGHLALEVELKQLRRGLKR
jgi:hypothetical protein